MVAAGRVRSPLWRRYNGPVITKGIREFMDRDWNAVREAKEAVAFAYLGYLHLTGRAGNVPTATGARGHRILGKRTPS